MKNPFTSISTGRARTIHGVEMTSVQMEHSLGILSIELPTPEARYAAHAINQHDHLLDALSKEGCRETDRDGYLRCKYCLRYVNEAGVLNHNDDCGWEAIWKAEEELDK
jgi:hypothetical protein